MRLNHYRVAGGVAGFLAVAVALQYGCLGGGPSKPEVRHDPPTAGPGMGPVLRPGEGPPREYMDPKSGTPPASPHGHAVVRLAIRDLRGVPVEGARVEPRPMAPPSFTDSRGFVEFSTEARPLRGVLVNARGFLPRVVGFVEPPTPPGGEVVVVLEDAARLQPIAPDGRPIEGWSIVSADGERRLAGDQPVDALLDERWSIVAPGYFPLTILDSTHEAISAIRKTGLVTLVPATGASQLEIDADLSPGTAVWMWIRARGSVSLSDFLRSSHSWAQVPSMWRSYIAQQPASEALSSAGSLLADSNGVESRGLYFASGGPAVVLLADTVEYEAWSPDMGRLSGEVRLTRGEVQKLTLAFRPEPWCDQAVIVQRPAGAPGRPRGRFHLPFIRSVVFSDGERGVVRLPLGATRYQMTVFDDLLGTVTTEWGADQACVPRTISLLGPRLRVRVVDGDRVLSQGDIKMTARDLAIDWLPGLGRFVIHAEGHEGVEVTVQDLRTGHSLRTVRARFAVGAARGSIDVDLDLRAN